jgi:ABC-type transport system substrate-binding protein
MSTRALYKTTLALTLFSLALAACQPIEIPVTVVVQQTRIVPLTATPPGTSGSETRPYTTPHPILGDVRIRQGIAHCTDRAALIRSVYPWLEDPTLLEMDSFLPRGHWAYPEADPDLARYPFDPDKGRALFEEAGWTLAVGAAYRANAAGEEMALKLTTTNAVFRQTWAAVFENQMAACGLRVLRFHTPATWFFGDRTGLARRDFEMAAFAWVNEPDPGGRTLYACDQIPSPENDWRGQNFTGWCNPKADEAIRAATHSLFRDERKEAYGVVQEEFTRDLPTLPLFRRVDVMAINPALQNLVPNPSGWLYTWNAAQWVIPGRDTIVIGEDVEPASLFVLEPAYAASVLGALITGVDYTSLNYEYQPVMLTQMPTIESGAAESNTVEVHEGDLVVDADGNAAELRPGVRLRDAEGSEVEFAGGAARMKQLVVRYEFVDGLRWSDGMPVSKADYELGYRLTCNREIGSASFWETPFACGMIAEAGFVGDTTYVVTWKPGYQDPLYFLPPFTRLPAHQKVSDGRRLADVPFSQWGYIEDALRAPLGVGPYVLKEWVNGQRMVFTANPYYYQGPPATPHLVVRFLETGPALAALAAGQVDVLDWETLRPEHAPQLLEAQAAGQVRVFLTPSNAWELVDFALFTR